MTTAFAAATGHLYETPVLKENDKGKYCRVRFWTADKIKGEEKKKFTSWGGLVSGPQAEWICKDGKKGTLIQVSGSIRLDTFKKQDGTESHTIEFTRVLECRSLEKREEAQSETQEPPPRKPAPAKPVEEDPESPPF